MTETVYARVERLCGQWERTAGPLPPDARRMLRELVREIAMDAGAACDARASVEARPLSVRNEAIKCGMAVRHALLCEPGERCCYRCDGAGCEKCGQRGVVEEGRR